MITPQASIVIPCYNSQGFIKETLESCLTQSRKRIEVIVVDDCSTDNSRRIIDIMAKKDDRIRPIYLDKNAERSNARNVGVSNAKSDIILMLDSDDIAMDNRVDVTLKMFNKHKDIDILYGDFHVMDVTGNAIGYANCFEISLDKIKKTLYNGIGHSTMAVRKLVFDKFKYPGGEWDKLGIDDWKFQWDCFIGGIKFLALKQPLALYRIIPKLRDENRVAYLKHLEIKAFEDKK